MGVLSVLGGDALAKVVGGVVDTASDSIKRVVANKFPDPVEQAKVNAAVEQGIRDADYKDAQLGMSAILAEAQSADPWTSRARPTFLYLMYAVIVWCFIGGIVGIWWPTQTGLAAANIKDLLAAVPDSLWWLFGAGYLGYTGARSFDKWKGAAK